MRSCRGQPARTGLRASRVRSTADPPPATWAARSTRTGRTGTRRPTTAVHTSRPSTAKPTETPTQSHGLPHQGRRPGVGSRGGVTMSGSTRRAARRTAARSIRHRCRNSTTKPIEKSARATNGRTTNSRSWRSTPVNLLCRSASRRIGARWVDRVELAPRRTPRSHEPAHRERGQRDQERHADPCPHPPLPLLSARDHSGTCDRTMIRGSVISSIAYFNPSRPNPESLAPPYGI